MLFPYFDAHCDTLSTALRKGESLRKNSLHLDLERLGHYCEAAQVFALFTRPKNMLFNEDYTKDASPEALGAVYEELLDFALRSFEENSDVLTLCRSTAEALETWKTGRIAAFLAIEGAELIGCSEEKLREAYDKGVRLVNLTWNYRNALSGSNQTGGGLTEAGRHFIRTAQSMGVAIDLSHASDETFWETLEIAEKPVLAGHSDSRALCGHPRNLTDEMFTALAKKGGVAGINLYPRFLGEGASIFTAAEHIEHYLALGGEKAVCLGTDFDGIECTPAGLSGVQDMAALYNLLLRRGHSSELVADIFFGNLFRFLERAL